MPPLSRTISTITGSHYMTAATGTTNNANVSAAATALSTSNTYSGTRFARRGATTASVQAANDASMAWTHVLPPRRIIASGLNGTNAGSNTFYITNSAGSVDRPLHLPLAVNHRISARIPFPPNFSENVATQSLHSYRLFPVDSKSHEFRILADLLNPLSVCHIDQITNPTVWTRFVSARNQMLKTKCSDPTVLKELGLSDNEIAQTQQSLNFVRHNAVDAAPFDDNFTLLFHCTEDPEDVELIQRHGFDERLSGGGTLGRGIYFTDSAEKAASYDRNNTEVIFICGVLLGDCLNDSASGKANGLVKEPGKLPAERRYIDDRNFDSVMANGEHNEYAVYNRYQCYPMYKVTYSRMQQSTPRANASATLPPFVWIAQNEFHNAVVNSAWALHARTVFDDMKRMEEPQRLRPSTS